MWATVGCLLHRRGWSINYGKAVLHLPVIAYGNKTHLQSASRTAMSTTPGLHPTVSSRQSHQDLAKTNKQVKDQDITTPSHEAREGTSLVSKAHEVLIGKASIRYIQVHQWHPSSGQIVSQSANHPHHEQIASKSDPEDIHPIQCVNSHTEQIVKKILVWQTSGNRSRTKKEAVYSLRRSSRKRRCDRVCVGG